jgi:hypothetical protein
MRSSTMTYCANKRMRRVTVHEEVALLSIVPRAAKMMAREGVQRAIFSDRVANEGGQSTTRH